MMRKKWIVVVLLGAVLAGVSAAASGIEEGFFVDGLDGLLTKEPGVDVWSFTADSEIKMTEKRVIAAGEPIPMLPCSVLEQMALLAGDEQRIRVRLWALFTEYKHLNYLFGVYFLPLQADGTPAPQEPKEIDAADEQPDQAQEAPAPEESIIPQDILSQIRKNEKPDLQKFQQIAAVTGDVNLIGRAGYLEEKNRVRTFTLDAFGMNKGSGNVLLLPNQMLADAEKQMARNPGRQRYTVSGLITTYKGRTYMLLRRASRTYTQGNLTQ